MTQSSDEILQDQYRGHCFVCGAQSTFVRAHRSLREGYQCGECRASLRYRGQAEALLETLGQESAGSLAELARSGHLAGLKIFEPGISGPFRKYLAELPGYVNSFFWPDVTPGENRDGVQCQDLEKLTFESDTFDLIISSDILEHVRRPWDAFRELHRVLRPGAYHVFSIPVQKPLRAKTVQRVDTSGEEDVHLVEPHYHGDGAGGKSLVYVDYGSDIVDRLADMDYLVSVKSPSDNNDEANKLLTFVTQKIRKI